ncbi:MAG: aminopeptidase P family protein [Acidobacteria bacterium]|nr:aminopeptidase P family protein [Acidobacteriota bacterium]MBV9622666.1 aminopeptidase P family protein [Acidobacteriota bacterium]
MMERDGLDALIVCGNQYAGFEGAVFYLSGFEIVHRYVYVVLPLASEPTLVFPREAQWIGDKSKPWVRDQVWPEIPGKWIAARGRERHWRRVGIYGLDSIMAVRDYRELGQGPFQIVPVDFQFDIARAVKSDEELSEIRDAMAIIVDGFWALVDAYEPGKTEAEIMAPAVESFFARGAGPRMMNILLSGSGGEAEASFKIPGRRVVKPDDLLLYSLEIAGPGGYWVEFSRPLIGGRPSRRTEAMAEAYRLALEAARPVMRPGERASSIHRAIVEVFAQHGFSLGHLSGHSIGATMIEHPAIGQSSDVELEENMVLSLHPQVVSQDGKVCLYTQDTYRVGRSQGECLADVPWKFFNGGEKREDADARSRIRKPLWKPEGAK